MLGSTISDGRKGNFIVFKGEDEEIKSFIVSRDRTIMWHQRLGNIGEKGLWALHNKGMVEGMFDYIIDLGLCEYFIYGK